MQSEWIPCKENLPCEKDGKVLISMPNGKVLIGTYSEFDNRWFKGDMMGIGGDDPTAWMPLPNPYSANGWCHPRIANEIRSQKRKEKMNKNMSNEDIERVLDELIKEAEENPDWKAVNALRCAKKELLS